MREKAQQARKDLLMDEVRRVGVDRRKCERVNAKKDASRFAEPAELVGRIALR